MKIKRLFPWLLGFLALLLLAFPAAAGGPPLVASDLEDEIQGLPRRPVCDPILSLQLRLAELKNTTDASRERRALTQAVSLIRIVRRTRISSTPLR